MRHSINVAKLNTKGQYEHIFRTDRQYTHEAIKTAEEFNVKFPEPEYSVSVSSYDELGSSRPIDEFISITKQHLS